MKKKEVFVEEVKEEEIDEKPLVLPKFMRKDVAKIAPAPSIPQEAAIVQDVDLDFEDDIPLDKLESAEKEAFKEIEDENKFKLVKDEPAIKLSNKPVNCGSNIFQELEGINFEDDLELDISISNLDLDLNTDTMKFFYWDAWSDQIKRPGEVFMFGKVEVPTVGNKPKEYKSIMVQVENVDKVLYLLPRPFVRFIQFQTFSRIFQLISQFHFKLGLRLENQNRN